MEKFNHFITLKDLPKSEIINLIRRSIELKKYGHTFHDAFRGKTLTMLFSKPSTRTRVSAESGWNSYGGSCLFLGKNDGQWGEESLRDTSTVISSMADAILVRCGPHSEIEEISKYSAVPVINALTDLYHPLQMLADLVTLQETFNTLDGVSVAWIGDANNVLNSWLVTGPRLGLRMTVATPKGYNPPQEVADYANSFKNNPIKWCNRPQDALKNVDVIVTDTWVSMGMENDKEKRIRDFYGWQLTKNLIETGGAKKTWKFMHCLPRKQEEVDDEIFYDSKRSLVWMEAENRKYTIMAVFELMLNNFLKRF